MNISHISLLVCDFQVKHDRLIRWGQATGTESPSGSTSCKPSVLLSSAAYSDFPTDAKETSQGKLMQAKIFEMSDAFKTCAIQLFDRASRLCYFIFQGRLSHWRWQRLILQTGNLTEIRTLPFTPPAVKPGRSAWTRELDFRTSCSKARWLFSSAWVFFQLATCFTPHNKANKAQALHLCG